MDVMEVPPGAPGETKKQKKKSFKRMPSYLREDLPQKSLQDKVSLLSKYSLGLDSALLASLPAKKKKKKKSRGGKKKTCKARNHPQNKEPSCSGAKTKLLAESRMSHLISDKTLETVQSPRRPLRGPSMSIQNHKSLLERRLRKTTPDVIEDEQKESELKNEESRKRLYEETLEVLEAEKLINKHMSSAEKRVHQRLMELQPPKAAQKFFSAIDKIEEAQREEKLHEIKERRRKNECKVELNKRAVKQTPEEYQREVLEKRKQFMQKLEADLRRANEKKRQIEQERATKVKELAEKRQSAAEKAAVRERLGQAGSAWYQAIYLCCAANAISNVHNSLQRFKFLRYKAIVIQRNVRIMLAKIHRDQLKKSRVFIADFVSKVVIARRGRRKIFAAKLISEFLINNRQNFRQIMLDWRRRVIMCQRFARQFIASTQSRVHVLSKLWARQERAIASLARIERRKQLEDHANRLAQASDEMQSSQFHRQMAKNWLRGVEVPAKLNIDTRDGKVYFPVGFHRKPVLEGRKDKEETRKDPQRNVEFVMDIFLNDEFRSRLEREKSTPLVLEPVPRAVRNEILRDCIAQARRKHRERLEVLKKERRMLEAQKIKVDLLEARKMLKENTNMEKMTKNMFVELSGQPVVLLYSTISAQEMFRMVQEAQARFSLQRSASISKIVQSLQFDNSCGSK